jgi:hypothetical protein
MLMVQGMQRKDLDTPDVIEDAKSKENTFAGNFEFSFHYF